MSLSHNQGLKLYLRLLNYVRHYWPSGCLILFAILINALTQVLLVDITQLLVDFFGENEGKRGVLYQIIVYFAGEDYVMDHLFRNLLLITLVILTFTNGLSLLASNFALGYISHRIVYFIRRDVFNHLLYIPDSLFAPSRSGELLSRITYSTSLVTDSITQSLQLFFRNGMIFIFITAYLFYLNWKVSLVFLLFMPLLGFLLNEVSKRLRKLYTHIQDNMGSVTNIASESIAAHREIRIYSGEDYEKKRFDGANYHNHRLNVKINTTNAVTTPVLQIVTGLNFVAIIWLLFILKEGETVITSGQLVAYIAAVGLLAQPIRKFGAIIEIIQRGFAAAHNIFQFIDTPPEKDGGRYAPKMIDGHIQIKGVNFSYTGKQKTVLHDIHLDLEACKSHALIGHSGAGKSTIIALLMRFYQCSSGKILIDGVDINQYNLSHLRRHIAFVPQSLLLFNDTIYNNIAYGELATADKKKVIAAAEAAHALEFIDNLPQGWKSVVGTEGVVLSEGQKQRILIARALLKNAPILILDEATSALDNEDEYYMQQALGYFTRQHTAIIIAHRLTTIKNADQIIAMRQGKVIEVGTHDELLAHNNYYARLYQQKFQD